MIFNIIFFMRIIRNKINCYRIQNISIRFNTFIKIDIDI